MPRPPETSRTKEQEQPPYYVASRFPTKQAAEQPYFRVQETIRVNDCDVSAYRFLRQWDEPHEPVVRNPWYIVVIGERPTDTIHQQVTQTLSIGETATLPQVGIDYLLKRRAVRSQEGEWVEKHYTMKVQRRNPKKDKLKRKQQNDSRRHNRGK